MLQPKKELFTTKVDNTRYAKIPFKGLKKLNVRNKTDEEIADERVKERKEGDKAKLNQWSTEVLKPKNWTRNNLAEASKGLDSKFRISDKPNTFDDYLNPAVMVGTMAKNLGEAPKIAKDTNSVLPYITSVGAPLVTGALAGIGASNTKQFVNNLVNPLAGVRTLVPNKQFFKHHMDAIDNAIGAKTIEDEVSHTLTNLESHEGNKRLVNQELGILKKLRPFNSEKSLLNEAIQNAHVRKSELYNIGLEGNSNQRIIDLSEKLKRDVHPTELGIVDDNAHYSQRRDFNPKDSDLPKMNTAPIPINNNFKIDDKFIEYMRRGIEGKGEIALGKSFAKSAPVANHEIGHALQSGHSTEMDDELIKFFNRPENVKEGILTREQNALDYFKEGSEGKEPTPFLREARQAMKERGLIKHEYDEFTPELIDKAIKHFGDKGYINPETGLSHTRVFDFANNISQVRQTLSNQFNKLPIITGAAIAGKEVLDNSDNTTENKKAFGGNINTNTTNMKYAIRPKRKLGIGGLVTGASTVAPYIAPAMGVVQGLLGQDDAEKAKEAMLAQYLQAKKTSDVQSNIGYKVNGNNDYSYYRNGGNLPQSSTTGKFDTTGGKLIPISNNAEVAVGNTHDSKQVDGQYGITLNDGQKDVAEVENQEVITDGQRVFSDRLMYDKNNTYADKMKKIATMSSKIEDKLSKTKDTKSKNGYERMLQGNKMAEDALYEHQEQAQHKEGLEEGKMAYGGKLPKYANGNNDDFLKSLLGDNNQNGFNRSSNKGQVLPNEVDTTSYLNNAVQTPITVTNPKNVNTKNPDAPKTFMDYLKPSLIDNGVNALLTATTPKLVSPIKNVAQRLKTNYNANLELAEVSRETNAIAQNVLQNTSDSATARQNIASARLQGAIQKGRILSQKENIETQLINQDKRNLQGVNASNTAMSNNFIDKKFDRANDIQTRISGNVANLSEDIKGSQQAVGMDKYYRQQLLLDLQNDVTGSKARAYKQNATLMADPEIAAMINATISSRKLNNR